MANEDQPKGLDEDAYLNAKRLFEETGDLRYLVIAIGKPKGSWFSDNEVPTWAVEACQDYAEFIRDLTRLERKRLHSVSVRPLLNEEEQALYKRAIKRHLGHLEAPNEDRPHKDELVEDAEEEDSFVSFDKALQIEGVVEPDKRRNFHRYRQQEMRLEPPSWEDEEPQLVNRRIEERQISRSRKRGNPKGRD